MQFKYKQVRTKVFFVLLSLVLLSSCSDNSTPIPSDGNFNRSVYENSFFQFEIELPDGWYIASKEMMDAVTGAGSEEAVGDDKNEKADFKAAQKKFYNLFQVFRSQPGAPAETYNNNISCVAEIVSHLPGITSGKDYIYHLKKLLQSGRVSIIFDKDIPKLNFGGNDFYRLNTSISLTGYKIHQEYFVTLINGYILAFITNYSGSEQHGTIDNCINSLHFF